MYRLLDQLSQDLRFALRQFRHVPGLAAEMRRLLVEAFPRAMAFVRPGFDEPWR